MSIAAPQGFAPQGPFVRQVCRACNNVCFVPESETIPTEGYRCSACTAASYERSDFDKSLPPPAPPATIEPGFIPPTEVQQPAEGDKSPNVDETTPPA